MSERWEGEALDPQEQFEHENADPDGPEEKGGEGSDEEEEII